MSGILNLMFDGQNRWVGGLIVPMDVNNYRVHFCPTPMKEPAAKKFFAYLQKISKKVRLSFEGPEIAWQSPNLPVEAVDSREDSSENPNGSLPGTKR